MNLKSWFVAIAATILISNPYYIHQSYAAAKFDDGLNPMAFANLPTCNAAAVGSRALITDLPSSINTWNQAVNAGGGTGVATIFCDGGGWKLMAGGAGTASPILAAPVTTLGNYGTGSCTGTPPINDGAHNCLRIDDHWTSTSLNTWSTGNPNGIWYAGLYRCNGSTTGNALCGEMPGFFPEMITFPLTSWCNGDVDGCQSWIGYSFGYGTSTTVSGLTLTHTPMQKQANGVLTLASKWYNTNPNSISGTYCTSQTGQSAGLNCNYANWIGGAMSLGGLNTATTSVGNTTALIPPTGGLMQFRAQFDLTGLSNGMYPGVECEAVDGVSGLQGGTTNANYELGYTAGGGSSQHVGFGLNNVANGSADITTGDDGVGSGNLGNWHTFALEWSGGTPGGAAGTWRYYIDGVLKQTSVENNGNPSIGWHCVFSQGAALNRYSSFHTLWNNTQNPQSTPLNGPGPYNINISDVQVYKKPGT